MSHSSSVRSGTRSSRGRAAEADHVIFFDVTCATITNRDVSVARLRRRSERVVNALEARAAQDIHDRDAEDGEPGQAERSSPPAWRDVREGAVEHQPRWAVAGQKDGQAAGLSWNIGFWTMPRSVITRKNMK